MTKYFTALLLIISVMSCAQSGVSVYKPPVSGGAALPAGVTACGNALPAEDGQVLTFDADLNCAKWKTPTGEGGALDFTVKEVDNNPTVETVDSLSFDQADGFAVSSLGSGAVRVDLTLTDSHIPNDITIDHAATADAFAVDPTDCSSGQYPNAIAADGDLTCSQVAGAQVSNTPAGNLVATTVQAAINELDTEKEPAGTYSGIGACPANQVTTGLNDGSAPTCSALTDSYIPDDIEVAFSDAGYPDVTNVEEALQAIVAAPGDGPNSDDSIIDFKNLKNVPPFRKTLQQLRPQAYEPPASSFATLFSRNGHPGLAFDGDVCATWSFVMPNTYGGNGVTVDVWVVSSETSNDTDWDGSWERMATTQDVDSDSFASAISADNNSNNATSGIPTKVSIAFEDGSQMDSCAADELCRFRLCRDATSDAGGTTNGQAVFIGGQIRETP